MNGSKTYFWGAVLGILACRTVSSRSFSYSSIALRIGRSPFVIKEVFIPVVKSLVCKLWFYFHSTWNSEASLYQDGGCPKTFNEPSPVWAASTRDPTWWTRGRGLNLDSADLGSIHQILTWWMRGRGLVPLGRRQSVQAAADLLYRILQIMNKLVRNRGWLTLYHVRDSWSWFGAQVKLFDLIGHSPNFGLCPIRSNNLISVENRISHWQHRETWFGKNSNVNLLYSTAARQRNSSSFKRTKSELSDATHRLIQRYWIESYGIRCWLCPKSEKGNEH